MKHNITACIVAQDESFTLESSLLSISKHVNEVLVYEDNSSDNTAQVLNNTIRNYQLDNVRVLGEINDSSLAEIRNYVESQARYDWIIWWDADFVAANVCKSDTESFASLLEILVSQEKRDYLNQILYTGVNVGPCVGYDILNKPLHGSTGDTQIVKKGFMSFVVDDFVDSRRYSMDRNCAYNNYLGKSWFYHIDIKNPVRLAIRPYIYEYRKKRIKGEFIGIFGDYLISKLGHIDKWRLVDNYCRVIETKLVSYDVDKWGELPSEILDLKKTQPLELIDGKLELTLTGKKMIELYNWEKILQS